MKGEGVASHHASRTPMFRLRSAGLSLLLIALLLAGCAQKRACVNGTTCPCTEASPAAEMRTARGSLSPDLSALASYDAVDRALSPPPTPGQYRVLAGRGSPVFGRRPCAARKPLRFGESRPCWRQPAAITNAPRPCRAGCWPSAPSTNATRRRARRWNCSIRSPRPRPTAISWIGASTKSIGRQPTSTNSSRAD